MSRVLEDLVDLLTLESIEENLFRGRSQDLGFRQLFGGQVLGQSLSAASQTVEEARHVHSMHGYFLRPGDAGLPVVYQVDRVRDGGSFSTRRVTAIQMMRMPIGMLIRNASRHETTVRAPPSTRPSTDPEACMAADTANARLRA